VGSNLGQNQAQKYHDAMLSWDQNYDTSHTMNQQPTGGSSQPNAAIPSPTNGIQPPATGLPLGASGAPAPANMPPAQVPSSSATPAPTQQLSSDQGSRISLADWLKAHNLKPFKNSENIFGTPKAQERAQTNITIAGMKEAGAKDSAQAKVDAEFKKTHTEVKGDLAKKLGIPEGTYPNSFITAQVGAQSRKETSKTTAYAKLQAQAEALKNKLEIAKANNDSKSAIATQKEISDFTKTNPKFTAVFGVPSTVGAGTSPANSTGAATQYSDPAKAQSIKADYQAGKITREEANKQLDALTGQ
jgi:hypothetical protein